MHLDPEMKVDAQRAAAIMFSVAPRFSFNKLSCAHDMIREALSSSIGRENKNLIMPTNLGLTIPDKIDAVDIASEAGK